MRNQSALEHNAIQHEKIMKQFKMTIFSQHGMISCCLMLVFVDWYLFLFERPEVEELLELLVAVVDAELLEVVLLEVLEAGDVQHAYEVGAGLEGKALVHPAHDEVEQPRVDGLGQSVPRVARRFLLQGNPTHIKFTL